MLGSAHCWVLAGTGVSQIPNLLLFALRSDILMMGLFLFLSSVKDDF